MARYIDADELLNNLPDDLPYKASVKRVLIQASKCEEELIDKIATYFEKDENWDYLKRDVWIIGGRSGELRRMLRESLRG